MKNVKSTTSFEQFVETCFLVFFPFNFVFALLNNNNNKQSAVPCEKVTCI